MNIIVSAKNMELTQALKATRKEIIEAGEIL